MLKTKFFWNIFYTHNTIIMFVESSFLIWNLVNKLKLVFSTKFKYYRVTSINQVIIIIKYFIMFKSKLRCLPKNTYIERLPVFDSPVSGRPFRRGPSSTSSTRRENKSWNFRDENIAISARRTSVSRAAPERRKKFRKTNAAPVDNGRFPFFFVFALTLS